MQCCPFNQEIQKTSGKTGKILPPARNLAVFCNNHLVRDLQIKIDSGIQVCAICVLSNATIKPSWTLFSYRQRPLHAALAQKQNIQVNYIQSKNRVHPNLQRILTLDFQLLNENYVLLTEANFVKRQLSFRATSMVRRKQLSFSHVCKTINKLQAESKFKKFGL